MELEGEPKDSIDGAQEVQTPFHLCLDLQEQSRLSEPAQRHTSRTTPKAHLVHPAEDVGVVLLEAADSGQAAQRSRQLVPVEHAEVGHPEGEFPPGARPVAEHQAARQAEPR